MDIVTRAVMNAGIVPSFNPEEVPEDIQARAADVLRNELIPQINCDRSLDITEIVYPASPKNCILDLKTPPLDYEYAILGVVPYSYRQFVEKAVIMAHGVTIYWYKNVVEWLYENGYMQDPTPATTNRTDKWPCDQFGTQRTAYVWTADYKLVNVSKPIAANGDIDNELLDPRYNLPFAPMRVEEVYRATDGMPLQYVHAGEFVSSEFRYSTLVYMTEDYADRLRIRFTPNLGGAKVLVILPVPIKCVNSYEEPNPWEGAIIAPEKFRGYLIAKLAFRMAIEYGVSTAEQMKVLENTAYQALLKNPSKHEHAQDVSRKISNYLERGRVYGMNGNGYSGGFHG
jgi:hypothetical protein